MFDISCISVPDFNNFFFKFQIRKCRYYLLGLCVVQVEGYLLFAPVDSGFVVCNNFVLELIPLATNHQNEQNSGRLFIKI